jgi:hypothetical protein
MLGGEAKPTTQDIEEQLHHILSSKVFAAAQRSQNFLRYVVERSLKDENPPLKEFAIATDVFGRGNDYDPAIDAAVRVEAGRLRGRLREYYDVEGKDDPVWVDIPKGGYSPAFAFRQGKLGSATEAPLTAERAGSVETILGRQTRFS